MGPHASHRRRRAGFTLIECLVVVAVLGIVSAIAIPAAKAALTKSRNTSAVKSVKVLETAVIAYMLDKDTPPLSLNTTTLEPLVGQRFITVPQRKAILSTLEGNQLMWYYGYTSSGWYDYDYGVCFRPKKERSDVYYYMWPEGIWRLDSTTWTEVM